MRESAAKARRAALGSFLGLAVVIGASWIGRAPPRGGWRPGPIRAWVADRDGQRVVGLDADLHETRSLAVRHPVAVRARLDGGAWVVSTERRDPRGPHTVLLVAPDGSIAERHPLGTVLDLETVDGADAIVLELGSAAPNRVLRLAKGSGGRPLVPAEGALAVAGRGERILVGCEDGWLHLFDAAGEVVLVARRRAGERFGDVAPGPEGCWWALDVAGGGSVQLLDEDLVCLWVRPTGLSALQIAPVPGEERIWVASASEPTARLYGSGGSLEADAGILPLPGLDRAAAAGGGEVLLVAPGAVLALDPLGSLVRTQGGFAFLVDVDLVPAG